MLAGIVSDDTTLRQLDSILVLDRFEPDRLEQPRTAASEEVVQRMDIPVSSVRKVLKIAQQPISLESRVGEEEDSRLGDFIQDTPGSRLPMP